MKQSNEDMILQKKDEVKYFQCFLLFLKYKISEDYLFGKKELDKIQDIVPTYRSFINSPSPLLNNPEALSFHQKFLRENELDLFHFKPTSKFVQSDIIQKEV